MMQEIGLLEGKHWRTAMITWSFWFGLLNIATEPMDNLIYNGLACAFIATVATFSFMVLFAAFDAEFDTRWFTYGRSTWEDVEEDEDYRRRIKKWGRVSDGKGGWRTLYRR